MTWKVLTLKAPHIAGVFERRHRATGNLCLLATLRSDGYPRISPMEPRLFEDDLWLVGMPHTTKFHDLDRDPRFSLHTATTDPHVNEGDAKIWGQVEHVGDHALHQRFATHLFNETGFDLRGKRFDRFLRADIEGAACVEMDDGHLEITTWRIGSSERVSKRT